MNAPPELAALGLALGQFGTGLSQHARLITLASAQDGSLPEAPAVEAFRGREAVNELFAFEVDALSTSADLDLGGFIGEELSVGLLGAILVLAMLIALRLRGLAPLESTPPAAP